MDEHEDTPVDVAAQPAPEAPEAPRAAVEAHAQARATDPSIFAAARALHGWVKGELATAAEYDHAIARAAGLQIG